MGVLCACDSEETETKFPPFADFSIHSNPVAVGESIEFIDASKEGSGEIIKWSWDFGDSSAQSDVQNPEHSYQQKGNYGVRLSVEDVHGLSSEVEKQIAVELSPMVEYDTLRIMTYNIFHGETTAGKIDMDLFAEIIQAENPDLVALQEVDVNCRRSGSIDQVKELADRTDMQGYFCKFIDYQGGEYGSAILSRLPVETFSTWPMYNNGGEQRAFGVIKVQLEGGRSVYFNSSHLSNRSHERASQISEIIDYYNKQLNRQPLIVCGDLNTEAHAADMLPLLREFKVADTRLNNTFSTRTGMRKKIDFILMPNNDDWVVLDDVKVIFREDASDHCALFTTLGVIIKE